MSPPRVGVIMILILTLMRIFSLVAVSVAAGRVPGIPGRLENRCYGCSLANMITRQHSGTSLRKCALVNPRCANP